MNERSFCRRVIGLPPTSLAVHYFRISLRRLNSFLAIHWMACLQRRENGQYALFMLHVRECLERKSFLPKMLVKMTVLRRRRYHFFRRLKTKTKNKNLAQLGLFVSGYLGLSVCISLSVCLSLFVSVCLSRSVSVSLSVSFGLCQFVCLVRSLSLAVSQFIIYPPTSTPQSFISPSTPSLHTHTRICAHRHAHQHTLIQNQH